MSLGEITSSYNWSYLGEGGGVLNDNLIKDMQRQDKGRDSWKRESKDRKTVSLGACFNFFRGQSTWKSRLNISYSQNILTTSIIINNQIG